MYNQYKRTTKHQKEANDTNNPSDVIPIESQGTKEIPTKTIINNQLHKQQPHIDIGRHSN